MSSVFKFIVTKSCLILFVIISIHLLVQFVFTSVMIIEIFLVFGPCDFDFEVKYIVAKWCFMVLWDLHFLLFVFVPLPFKVKLVFWQKCCFLVSLVKISINVFVNLLVKVKLTVAKCCFLVLLVIFRTHSFCSIFSCFHQPYRDFHSFSARLIKIWFICRIQLYNQIAGFSYFLLVLAVSPSAWL